MTEYVETIKELSLKYQNIIEVYMSLEIDYVPQLSKSFKLVREKFGLDYTIGSVHLVRNPKNNKLWFISSNFHAEFQKISCAIYVVDLVKNKAFRRS